MSETIESIGEQGLLQLVQQFCPAGVVGDDAAVLPVVADESLVVTTDVLVDRVHFSDRTTPAHSVGWRAIAANLSDLAAMGATPLGVTVGLGLPGDTTVAWVEGLYQGMSDCLAKFGGTIVGGDLVRSSVRTISITAFGQVKPGDVMRRSGAQVGDVIVVTGFHGNSRAGLELLLKPELGSHTELVLAHQYPRPRFDIANKLWGIAHACMDSSDGLADAVLQICRSSQVGAVLDQSQLPIDPVLSKIFPEQSKQWCLYGGEDFELVLCLPENAVPAGCLAIGRIVDGQTVVLMNEFGEAKTLRLDHGFQHFST
jgi:thiamine-monophosphate kinase